MEGLARWRRQRPSLKDPIDGQARSDQDVDWALDLFAACDEALLHEPTTTTIEQLMEKYCRTTQQRLDFCEQFWTFYPTVFWILDQDEGPWMVDVLYYRPWSFPDKEIGLDLPGSAILCVCCYEPREAKRIVAWLEVLQCAYQGSCHTPVFIPEEDFDVPDTDEMEIDLLEEEYNELAGSIIEAENILAAFEYRRSDSSDPESYSRQDFVDPGLEWAILQERAGRRMREEYEHQCTTWSIIEGGWEGIESSWEALKPLKLKIEHLRKKS
jgi:hypothetical protein